MLDIKRSMSASACVWGGIYNPIIPVYRQTPKVWAPVKHETERGYKVAHGYIRFFEPDVYVEAVPGLAEKAGLGHLHKIRNILHPLVISLDDFLSSDDHRSAGPRFGINIIEVLQHRYSTEQKFVLRDPHSAVLPLGNPKNGLAECLFGRYPDDRELNYIRQGYQDVFHTTKEPLSVETWRNVFEKNAETPLGLTRHKLNIRRTWDDDPDIFVFDPEKPTDLIELWNKRLLPAPVMPIPIDWAEELVDAVQSEINATFRPLRGNPSGIMHSASLVFASSIEKHQVQSIGENLTRGIESRACSIGTGISRIWCKPPLNGGPRYSRLDVFCEDRSLILEVSREEKTIRIEPLIPSFSKRYSSSGSRWVNEIMFTWSFSTNLATVLPPNFSDRTWPRLRFGGQEISVTSDGWALLQDIYHSSEEIRLMTPDEAISSWLKCRGISASISEPGRLTRDMLSNLEGLWGIELLAHRETIELLNKMAGKTRTRANKAEFSEETFENRTADSAVWNALVERRKKNIAQGTFELARYTKSKVIQLGLETICAHCKAPIWRGMDEVGYTIKCDRCLKEFDFPQRTFGRNKPEWKYRVIGPFSVPDYGRGSYPTLLAFRAIGKLVSNVSSEFTFSPSLNLETQDGSVEIDFAMWTRNRSFQRHSEDVDFLIGETKAFADEAIRDSDLKKLQKIGKLLPGAIIVIAVLKDDFSKAEKRLLKRFVEWARRPDEYMEPTNPVVLLTGRELFCDFSIRNMWRDLGEPYAKLSDSFWFDNIQNFSFATQAVHLGMLDWYHWLAARRKKKRRKKL